jgi:hypothetical protein
MGATGWEESVLTSARRRRGLIGRGNLTTGLFMTGGSAPHSIEIEMLVASIRPPTEMLNGHSPTERSEGT